MTPAPGEIWIADLGAETRRTVYVVSDPRFHRLAERVLVVPLVPRGESDASRADTAPPWWIPHGDAHLAVERLTTLPVDRLLERRGTAGVETVRSVGRAVERIAAIDR